MEDAVITRNNGRHDETIDLVPAGKQNNLLYSPDLRSKYYELDQFLRNRAAGDKTVRAT